MSLQMVLFHSFSWLSTIPLCVCVCVRAHTHTCTLSHVRLCSPMYYSPPGSSVHEIFLEQVAISSSRGSSQPRDGPHISVSPALVGGFFITSATWEYVLFFPFICQWTSRLLPCFGYCEYCHYEHRVKR